jgi:hypothetical protein
VVKISFVLNPDFTKSSVFSLASTTTEIIVNRMIEKKNVPRNFLRIYQSSFFMIRRLSGFEHRLECAKLMKRPAIFTVPEP